MVEKTGQNRCRNGLDVQVDWLVIVLVQYDTVVVTIGASLLCKPISHLANQSRDCGLINFQNAAGPQVYPKNLLVVEIIEGLTIYTIAIETVTVTTHIIWVGVVHSNKTLQMKIPVGSKGRTGVYILWLSSEPQVHPNVRHK